MDTKFRWQAIVDYDQFYGEGSSKHQEPAELIKNIPSITLLNYISGFSVNLYLNENSEVAQTIQIHLLNNVITKGDQGLIAKWRSVIENMQQSNFVPVIFFNHSNLQFYDLIFTNYNTYPSRDLNKTEAKQFLDAYLLINQKTSDRFKINGDDLLKADAENRIEDVLLPNFIYQKDYISSLDFTNQIARGEMFFNYLEANSKYSEQVSKYYTSLSVPGYINMFKNLLMIFSELKIETKNEARIQLVNFEPYGTLVNLNYLETLCINSSIENYTPDISFSILRNRVLFKISTYRFFVLNINFFLDQFYKAQVFKFNSFLKQNKVKGDFLAVKGKEFTEEIYLPKVMKEAFPDAITHFGAKTKNENEELVDFYMRENSKLLLCEFKDVLLNASIKNSGDKDILFEELDKKFLENQFQAPKGIRQILNALKHINDRSFEFDVSLPPGQLEIFPIIVYTDLSFGAEGINKKYNDRFKQELANTAFKNLKLHDFTFINLNFFEVHQEYFSDKILNLFNMLVEFHIHIQKQGDEVTPFEVFSRFYLNENNVPDLKVSKTNKELFSRLIES